MSGIPGWGFRFRGGAAEDTYHTSASVADEPGREDQSDSVRADSGSTYSRSRTGRGGGPIGGKDSSPSGAPSAAGARLE